jgi:formiminotetrahydrofolate cyclodeaminase
VTALTVAAAAGLAAMAARHAPETPADALEELERLRAHATALADQDAAAYGEVLAGERDGDPVGRRDAWDAATAVPLEIASCAARVATLVGPLARGGKARLRGDARAAVTLAEAGARSAAELVACNVRAGGLDETAVARARDVCAEAAAALAASDADAAGR